MSGIDENIIKARLGSHGLAEEARLKRAQSSILFGQLTFHEQLSLHAIRNGLILSRHSKDQQVISDKVKLIQMNTQLTADRTSQLSKQLSKWIERNAVEMEMEKIIDEVVAVGPCKDDLEKEIKSLECEISSILNFVEQEKMAVQNEAHQIRQILNSLDSIK